MFLIRISLIMKDQNVVKRILKVVTMSTVLALTGFLSYHAYAACDCGSTDCKWTDGSDDCQTTGTWACGVVC